MTDPDFPKAGASEIATELAAIRLLLQAQEDRAQRAETAISRLFPVAVGWWQRFLANNPKIARKLQQ